MPRLELDYDASVPGTDVVQKAPIHVKMDPDGKPVAPGSRVVPGATGERIPDFVPSPEKQAEFLGAPPPPPKPRVHDRSVIIEPEDYLSPEQSQERIKSRKDAILRKAKEIFAQSRSRRDQFKIAKKLVDNATEEELDDPTKKLARAVKIVDHGIPMTKKKAIEEAKRQVLGHATNSRA